MSELPISDEAVEAVATAEAMWQGVELEAMCERHQNVYRTKAKRAIRAFLQAEGFEVDRDIAGMDDRLPRPDRWRLVSNWKPIEQITPGSNQGGEG